MNRPHMPRFRRLLQSLFFIALLSTSGLCQQYSVTSWGHKDGLASTAVYAVAQTEDGYLWLGTGDGLIRFDGFQFTSVNVPDLGSRSLGKITTLRALSKGGLAIGTASGSLIVWNDPGVILTAINEPIQQIQELPDLRIEIETPNRSILFNRKDLSTVASAAIDRRYGVPTQIALEQKLHELSPGSIVRRGLYDTASNLWIATDNRGIFKVAPNGSVIYGISFKTEKAIFGQVQRMV
jgi:ligand-binding sensor domain-containing protein